MLNIKERDSITKQAFIQAYMDQNDIDPATTLAVGAAGVGAAGAISYGAYHGYKHLKANKNTFGKITPKHMESIKHGVHSVLSSPITGYAGKALVGAGVANVLYNTGVKINREISGQNLSDALVNHNVNLAEKVFNIAHEEGVMQGPIETKNFRDRINSMNDKYHTSLLEGLHPNSNKHKIVMKSWEESKKTLDSIKDSDFHNIMPKVNVEALGEHGASFLGKAFENHYKIEHPELRVLNKGKINEAFDTLKELGHILKDKRSSSSSLPRDQQLAIMAKAYSDARKGQG